MVKGDEKLKGFLPDWSEKHRPNKSYLCNVINTVYEDSIVNMIKKVKAEKLEEKQKEAKDYLIIDADVYEKLIQFESLYEAEEDKKNRLAGLMCESRKKEKKERKEKFIFEVTEKKFSEFLEE